ncbi:hypothetical protein [Corallococcus macrosporus]|nr:hypothetical protein [Corallococcus macrosporus]
MFASSAVTAQAAEVSTAQRVETTPGLSPDDIRPLSGDDRLPSPDAWRTALKRLLSERGPRMAPSVRHGVEAVLSINMRDAAELIENSMNEAMASRIDCPRLRAWKQVSRMD